MGEQTAISWCDHTKNLWWGCWKIADECKNCYADSTANRYAPGHWGRTAPRKFFGDKNLNELLKWNRAARSVGERRRVFVGSMMDWAEIHPVAEINAQMDERRAAFWALVPQCESLDFLMLTKRIENAARILPWCRDGSHDPMPNVWIGVTAGTVASLRRAIPFLREIPAAVRFISCEPLLESISAADWDWALGESEALCGVDWLIVGDESGHGRRDAHLDWVRVARDAAARHGVAFHFKQWNTGERKKVHLPMLDGQQWAQFPEVSRG